MPLPATLQREIDRYGYHPGLIAHSLEIALGGQEVRAQVVLAESAFDTEEVRRHMTVVVLTSTRLLITHTDDAPARHAAEIGRALTTTESVLLRQVSNVSMTMAFEDPEDYRAGQLPAELVLWVTWGGRRHTEIDVSVCLDPNCEADHGYSADSEPDDFSLTVSLAGNGADAMRQALDFARLLHAEVQ